MEYLRVEGYNELLRDPVTNSIINTNMSEYQQYIATRNVKRQENQKVQTIEEEVSSMKEDLDEIKFLLRSLLDGSK